MFNRKPTADKLPETKAKSQKFKEEVDRVATRLFGMQLDFFKAGYYAMMKIAVGEFFVIAGLVVVVLVLISRGAPAPDYFSVDQQGRVAKMDPVSVPALDDEKIRQFVVDAIGGVMNLTYLDYDERIERGSEYFTDDGFMSYKRALRQDGLEEQVKGKQLLLKTVSTSAPIVETKGSFGGIYAWVVKAKASRTLTDRSKERNSDIVFTFYIRRVPSTERPRMVGIYKIEQDLAATTRGVNR